MDPRDIPPPPPILHAATHADLPELHALIESAYRGDTARAGWTHEADLLSDTRTDLAELAAIVDGAEQELLYARESGRIVACLHLLRAGDGLVYLGLFAVMPGLQGSGIGRHMLAAAEREAQARFGGLAIELTVLAQRRELIAWYERRGFVATGEMRPFPVPLDPPFTLIVLRKPVEPAGRPRG